MRGIAARTRRRYSEEQTFTDVPVRMRAESVECGCAVNECGRGWSARLSAERVPKRGISEAAMNAGSASVYLSAIASSPVGLPSIGAR